jgi:hypothetical protein
MMEPQIQNMPEQTLHVVIPWNAELPVVTVAELAIGLKTLSMHEGPVGLVY